MMHANCTLRTCTPGDEEALALVGAASFLEAFAGVIHGSAILGHCRKQHAIEKYRDLLASPDAHSVIAEVGGVDSNGDQLTGAPVGYAVLCPPDLPIPFTADDIELKRIYLLHRFQKMGIGGELMNWAIDKARALNKQRLLLGVYGKNDQALEFYAHHGFQRVGRRTFQVGDREYEDAVLALKL